MTRDRSFVRAVLTAVMIFAGVAFFSSSAWAVGEEKAGPFMGNVKIGPAVSFGNTFAHPNCGFGCVDASQFALQLEIAGALDRKNAAYLGFNPQFQFGFATIINLTATFQYDFEIATSKVRGLYIYPKINVGGAIFPGGGYFRNGTGGAFALQPEVGVKFNINKNFHVLGEPLSFPIYLGSYTFAQYRFWLGCGFDI